VNCVIVLSVE